jgi:hypothetical protein
MNHPSLINVFLRSLGVVQPSFGQRPIDAVAKQGMNPQELIHVTNTAAFL